MELVKKTLAAKYGVPADRIMIELRHRKYATEKKEAIAAFELKVDMQILGRQPMVISPLETLLLAPAADERAAHADSLKLSEVSAPFSFKVGFSIVRLDAREKARRKTFEEAGAEVSSLFQDYEAKRLEKVWLERVENKYPVVQNKESLRQAFATPQN